MNDAKANPIAISDAPINAAIAKCTDMIRARMVHVMNDMISRICMLSDPLG
jgi:hypothetical protein